MSSEMHRRATHAGSWYTDSASVLANQLTQWLGEAASNSSSTASTPRRVRGIIAPHAGYSYSGPTAAFAYDCIDPTPIKRIFVLGPSHHYALDTCALSQCTVYDTPLGPLTLDRPVIEELHATGNFEWMRRQNDEDEHSIEMHLPYIAHVMKKNADFKIVPILVGSLGPSEEQFYGEMLSRYLADEENFFVISSDFCHWGSRFSFRQYDESHGAIHKSIEAMDREAMGIIERIDPVGFSAYLKRTRNTICGRHPIGLFLNTVTALKKTDPGFNPTIQFTRYAQSNHVVDKNDSSVSYAAAICFLPNLK